MAEYADEEISEILGRALSKDDQIGLTHEELTEIAAEVGISTDQLEQAAAEVRAERVRRSDLDEAKHAVALKKRRDRRGWLRHFFTYGVVIAGLALLDWVNPPMTWWFYPAIGWGMAVALQGSRLLFGDEEAELDRQLRRIEKKRAKARRAAEKRSRKSGKALLSEAETSFEAALEKGITLLLTKAAEKIEAATAEPLPADTELGRFIAKKKGVPTRVDSSADAARVRVDEEEQAAVEIEAEMARRRREAER